MAGVGRWGEESNPGLLMGGQPGLWMMWMVGTIGRKISILIATIPGAWKLPQGERTSYNVALPTLLQLCTGMSVSFLSWGPVSEDI